MSELNNLIPINYENSDRPTVSGRELHAFLGVNSNYTTWFGRMTEYGFTEHEDYESCFPNLESENQHGGQNKVDHQLTIPMAKELCMIQRNERGKQARQYFLQVEQMWNSPEAIMRRAVLIACKQNEELKASLSLLTAKNKELTKQNEYMAPRADYCDNVLQSTTVTYLPTAIAKEYGWSAKKLNKILNELDIIYKVDDCWHLYSCCDGKGYVEYSKRPYYDYIHGKMDERSQMRWTELGKAYIYDRLKKIGYLPREEAARKVRSH